MRDLPACREGGFALLEQTEEGKYQVCARHSMGPASYVHFIKHVHNTLLRDITIIGMHVAARVTPRKLLKYCLSTLEGVAFHFFSKVHTNTPFFKVLNLKKDLKPTRRSKPPFILA